MGGRLARRASARSPRLGDRGEADEVRVGLDRREVRDDEERRVLQGVLVVDELAVRCLQVLALALVLPGEEALLPDVDEAVTAVEPVSYTHLTLPTIYSV